MIPRPEFPNPQFERKDWINLNGEWEFELDLSASGEDKEFFRREKLNDRITVPFCPESDLSGVGFKDFIPCVWYRKELEIPKEWKGKNILLHFGAVDYHAKLYVNGELACEHKGGYTHFYCDITKYLKEDNNSVILCAYDDVRSNNQPAGKQSGKAYSFGCYYTRTTGIWQTVWMEAVGENHIKNFKIYPNVSSTSANIEISLSQYAAKGTLNVKAFFEGREVGETSAKIYSNATNLTLNLREEHLWNVGAPNLYELVITYENEGEVYDTVYSYFGLREVALTRKGMYINGKFTYGRFVLDQGFYPDGIYTAPDEKALKKDIEDSMALGFNGARMHEKVFEPRYIYWADKLGYLTWGEQANWGLDITDPGQIQHFIPEWIEAVERDFNHPSIIGWCPFNETWNFRGKEQANSVIKDTYLITKALDKTRPCIDTSGNYHTITDIYDYHDYMQDPDVLREQYKKLDDGEVIDQVRRNEIKNNPNARPRQSWKGEPLFCSEYGGIKWDMDALVDGVDKEQKISWGYGDGPKTEEEFISRYEGLLDALLEREEISMFCYTQLYDVEQERNGLMTYDRKMKFDPKLIHKITKKKAKCEEV